MRPSEHHRRRRSERTARRDDRAAWSFALLTAAAGCGSSAANADAGPDRSAASGTFDRFVLTTEFLAEGAAFGDLNADAVTDVVAGPYWYEGPDYQNRRVLYEPTAFNPASYSDNFFAFVRDLDRDGYNDVLVVGFPGQDARWYRNPRNDAERWERHEVFFGVDVESPHFADLTGDGEPELVFAHQGRLGYARPGERPEELWTFHPVSPPGPYGAFTHGLGVGDVNGDGRADVLDAGGYWEQPLGALEGALFTRRAASFGRPGGGQIVSRDVDGDGDVDVIATLDAHGYGLAWFERSGGSAEAPTFVEHVIVGAPGDAVGGVMLHEPHALAVVDVNRDGLGDIVAGERFWGHYPGGAATLADPAHLYWFEARRDGNTARFVPHLIDAASGVGTQVVAEDANGDGLPDIVVSNKKGTFVFRQREL